MISPKNAGIILNSLAKLGYESADLEGLNIKNLTKNLNGDLSSKELLETILGCSRLVYDKGQLGIDEKKLCGNINSQYAKFSLRQKVFLMNSLAKLGYKYDAKSNPDLLKTLLKTYQELQKKSYEFDGQDLALFIHSSAKLQMFDQLAEKKNELQSAFSGKIESLSSNSAFSLLQAHLAYGREKKGEEFFSTEIIQEVADKFHYLEGKKSKTQEAVAAALSKMGYGVVQEYPISRICGKPV